MADINYKNANIDYWTLNINPTLPNPASGKGILYLSSNNMNLKLSDGSVVQAGGLPSLTDNAGKHLMVSSGEAGVEWATINTSVGLVSVSTSKTLALTDANSYQVATGAATITVPPNSSVAFVIGTTVNILANTASNVTLAAGAGVSIISKFSLLTLDGQGAGASLIKIATDTWFLVGDLK